jgi:hypothetical protein
MTPTPFSLDVLATHKCFFLLDQIPGRVEDVSLTIVTPTGEEEVDFVDLFTMDDGRIIAAWGHPMQKLPNHNLIARCGETRQIINLNNIERVLPHFDRPVSATNGAFLFTDSAPLPNGDWRCDRGMYGPVPFVVENLPRVFNEASELIVFEHLLTVNGVGSIIYIESRNETPRGTYLIGNSVAPATTRTFQEMIRLVWEWAMLAEAPFHSTDRTAVQASAFLGWIDLTTRETEHIASMPDMQIGRFLSGATDARRRPDDNPPMTPVIESLLFNRMAASSLAFIVKRNPTLWNLNEILTEEQRQLDAGFQRFKEYYGIPADKTIADFDELRDIAVANIPNETPYIDSQLKQFDIKNDFLEMIAADSL